MSIKQVDAMRIIISQKVRDKLAKKFPPVTETEIRECFWNRVRSTVIDDREEHRTKPPTRWFVAETAEGRRLKIVFIQRKDGDVIVKTAYDPDEAEEEMYEQEA